MKILERSMEAAWRQHGENERPRMRVCAARRKFGQRNGITKVWVFNYERYLSVVSSHDFGILLFIVIFCSKCYFFYT